MLIAPQINISNVIESPHEIMRAALSLLGQSLHAMQIQHGHRDVGHEVAEAMYYPAVRYVLQTMRWSFAVRQTALSMVDDELGGAEYPNDYIEIISVGCCVDCCGVLVDTGWDERNGRIYPCCCADKIRYIFANEKYSTWTPIAKEMLIYRLAALCAAQITADRSNIIARNFLRTYEELRVQSIKHKKRRYMR